MHGLHGLFVATRRNAIAQRRSIAGRPGQVSPPRVSPPRRASSAYVRPHSSSHSASKTQLSVASWNLAAVNNNPFEYWIAHKDPEYNRLMKGVQQFIDDPKEMDVPIHKVFTQEMFDELIDRMATQNWEGLEDIKRIWTTEMQHNCIISGFLKNATLGKKRLISMPDRFTNTLTAANGTIHCRPTVINSYEAELRSMGDWWEQWLAFMFETQIEFSEGSKIPCNLLRSISRAKYPSVTEEEERLSIPLQMLCQGIFDSIMVHMMLSLAPQTWYELKMSIVKSLVKGKTALQCNILYDAYGDFDVLFLQEASLSFVETASQMGLLDRFHIITPKDMDTSRNQNSIILLNKQTWDLDCWEEFTDVVNEVINEQGEVSLSGGDLLALCANNRNGFQVVLASFHADTNGLCTLPMVRALNSVISKEPYKQRRLIAGIDANTHNVPETERGCQSVISFVRDTQNMGLSNNWGSDVDHPNKCYTTYNARTFLQPQLNKALPLEQLRAKGDVNPKDFLLFPKSTSCQQNKRDNTGTLEFLEDTVFPSLRFPSDHAIISATLEI